MACPAPCHCPNHWMVHHQLGQDEQVEMDGKNDAHLITEINNVI